MADIPIVQLKRDYKVVPRGDSVKLTCPIFGQPTPIITWSKGSETITDYAWTRFSLDKKSLKISQAEYDDTGIYICKGTNGYGSNEVRIDLFVIGEYLHFMFSYGRPSLYYVRKGTGWVGSEKWHLLLTFSTIYAGVEWVSGSEKIQKYADVQSCAY